MADQVTSITGTPAQPPASLGTSSTPIKSVSGVAEQTVTSASKPIPVSTVPLNTASLNPVSPNPMPLSQSAGGVTSAALPKPQLQPSAPVSQQVFPPKPITSSTPVFSGAPTSSVMPPLPPVQRSSIPQTSPVKTIDKPFGASSPQVMASPSSIPSPSSAPKPAVSSSFIPPASTSNSSSILPPKLQGQPISSAYSAQQQGVQSSMRSSFVQPSGQQPSSTQPLAQQSMQAQTTPSSIKSGISFAPTPMKVGAGAVPPQAPSTPAKVLQESPKPQQAQVSGQPPKEQPAMKMASPNDVKQSPFKFLPIILGVLALLGIGLFVFAKFFGANTPTPTTPSTSGTQTSTPAPVKQTTLTYWGLWESSPVMDQVLKDFSTVNPGVVVNYVQQSPKDYRERLADALKKGTGPDVFRYHATWVPMLKSGLGVMPASVMSSDEYTKTFYPIVSKQLKTADGVVGIPLMYDGLGLYYNKQIFTTANLPAPTSWAEVESAARALTVRSKDKKIDRAGIALGTTSNVDNFSDILGLLILQNGGDPSQPSTKLVADTVKYYTNFNKVMKVWDDTLPSSTYAFATEKTAMMIAPSWRAFEVKSINPNIQFAVAPVPQLPGASVAWASYWAEGVAKTSKQQDIAWKLLKYMSSKDVLLKMHEAAATKTPRLFGEIYPRTDMTAGLASDPYIGAFLSDAPKATSWWMTSRTFDNGINDKIIKYYEDAVNAVNLGTSTPEEALKTTQQGVQQVLLQSQQ